MGRTFSVIGRMQELAREGDLLCARITTLLEHRTIATGSGLRWAAAALVAGEDHRYYWHLGVDPIAIARATLGWLLWRRLSGASTIEQQLVRTLRQRYELTLGRKLSEIWLAVRVSRSFRKEDILVAYLEVGYFGWRATGLSLAGKRFKIDTETMGPREAAYLVSMLKVPLPKHPSADQRRRLERRASHICGMIDHG